MKNKKVLPIVKIPDPILLKKTKLVSKIDKSILELIDQMIETCRAANGIGLAAPQIGKSLNLCIINLEHLGLEPFTLINPKITEKSRKKLEMEEGCLSIPGVFGIVKRPKSIRVKALNINGKESEFEANGLLARVIQHEVDHLDGILFTTKMLKQTTGKPLKKM